jgi:16S rRNA (guanine(966)-N(2))-methyltransferase RsmD
MRVIAGQFKGRRLKAPAWEGLRPTSDKLRETLFNILAPRIDGASVFDCFAGTGAVGVEAMSRGAAHVTFIEHDRRAAALIESNLALCGAKQGYTIECGDVASVLGRTRGNEECDLILLDPPYDIDPNRLMRVLEVAAGRVAADGLVVLERARRSEGGVPGALSRVRDVMSGDSALTLFCRV